MRPLAGSTEAPLNDVPFNLRQALADRYELEPELGGGGMAMVYLATDLKHQRRVALKVLNPTTSAAVGRERFLREIETAARLQHPHILPVHDSGEAAGLLWYTMPFVDGESLRDRLRRDGALGIAEATQLGREIAAALDHAHRHGVVHRDIKPENVLLSDGQALVADFGIARTAHANGQTLTQTGFTLGTPAYMSPEQALGEREVDGRSDQYALGCLMFELLAGRPPYRGATAQAVVARHLTEPVPQLSAARPGVPPPVSSAVARAMAKDPEERFSSAGAFGDALAATENAALPRHSGPAGRRLIPALAVVVIAGLGALLLARNRTATAAADPRRAAPPLLAVFPLEAIGADSSQRYFTAGMTEEIAGQLSRLRGLRVVSSAVAQRYGDSADRLTRMARELGVGSVAAGTVRRSGDRVRIAVQLADAESGQTLWSEQYDRSISDVLEVQSEVARRVADALQAQLTPAEAARLQHPQTVDPAAYDLRLRSRVMSPSDPTENKAGIALLRKAVALDTGYADAWADMARRFFFVSIYGSPAYADSATAVARRALAIQPDLAEAYAVLGGVQSWSGRLSEAEMSYRKALALNPSNVVALGDLSLTEIVLGRPDEGLRLAVRAAPLGGNTVLSYYHVGVALLRLEDDEATGAWLRAGLRRSRPTSPRLELELSWLDLLRGRDAQALERARRLVARLPEDEEMGAWMAELATILHTPDAEALIARFAANNPEARSGWLLPESFGAARGLALRRRGQRARADSAWDAALAADQRDLERGNENPDRYLQTAAIHAIRGDTAAALQWLERGYRAGWNDARTLSRDPFFQSLGGEPRFRALLGRMTADVARLRQGVRAISDSLERMSRAHG